MTQPITTRLHDSRNARAFADDVQYYLSLQPRQLPSRHLYDEQLQEAAELRVERVAARQRLQQRLHRPRSRRRSRGHRHGSDPAGDDAAVKSGCRVAYPGPVRVEGTE